MNNTNSTIAPGLNKQTQSCLVETALFYARKHIPIFPLTPQSKVPMVKWGTEATTDPEKIKKWWHDNPGCNIGLVTGAKSGIAVIDFDSHEALARCSNWGLPKGPVVKTGRGFHYYCLYSEGVRNFQNRSDLPKVDLRAEGGYVVAPPSIHENGDVYTWFDGKGLDDLPLPPLPKWLLPQAPEEKISLEDLISGVSEGERNNTLVRLVGSWLSKGMSYEDIIHLAEQWNQRNIPPLDQRELVKTINSIYKREHRDIPVIEQNWQEPILFTGVQAATISANLLPSWLGEYARAVSKSTQTDEALAVMVGLSAVATAVQKKFVVSPNHADYMEPLCIWTVSVLQSSERKTPVFKAMTAPLFAWEKEQAHLLESQIVETNSIRYIEQKRIDKLRQEAVSTNDSEMRQRIIREIGDIQARMPDEIRAPRLWVGDTTPESLQDLLANNNERMAVLTDEGVIFEIMAGLYNDNKLNIDIFLQAYSGSPARIERKSRSVSLENPALTFGLTVQPAVIESLGVGSKKGLRGKGMLGRFLFCFPKSMMSKRDPRADISIPDNIKRAYLDGMSQLLNIRQSPDEDGVVLTLSSDALELWHNFSEIVEEELGSEGSLAAITDWGGKLPGNALRLAGLLHLVEHGATNLLISANTMENALELSSLLVSHAQMAFGIIGTDENTAGAKKVYQWIESKGFKGFARSTCMRALHLTADKLDKSLKMLEERHIIRKHRIDTSGRPSDCYEINPALI